MSCELNIRDCNFVIKKDKFADILLDFDDLSKKRNYFYLNFFNCDSIEEIFHQMGFCIIYDKETEDIVSIESNEVYLKGCNVFFEHLLPYIEDMSWIEVVTEDSQIFRWYFKDKQLFEVYPEFVWKINGEICE